jgi:hypothetical protein
MYEQNEYLLKKPITIVLALLACCPPLIVCCRCCSGYLFFRSRLCLFCWSCGVRVLSNGQKKRLQTIGFANERFCKRKMWHIRIFLRTEGLLISSGVRVGVELKEAQPLNEQPQRMCDFIIIRYNRQPASAAAPMRC